MKRFVLKRTTWTYVTTFWLTDKLPYVTLIPFYKPRIMRGLFWY